MLPSNVYAVLDRRGLTNEKTLKFGVSIIENGLFLENIMELKGLMKDDGVVASEGIASFPVDKIM